MGSIYSDDIRKQLNEEFSQYIFYERAGRSPTGEYICQCSRCKSEYVAAYSEICGEGFTLKHKDKALCPKCKHIGILFHKNKGKKCLTEQRFFVVWHKDNEDSVTAYCIKAAKAYNGDPWEKWLNSSYSESDWTPFPEICIEERAIYHFRPGDVNIEKYTYWGGWNEISPKMAEPFGGGFMGNCPEYTFINESVLQATFMRYSSYKLYLDYAEAHWNYYNFYAPRLMKYLCLYVRYPNAEMLLKAGLGRYVIEAVEEPRQSGMHKRYFNWSACRPSEFFKGITPQQARQILDYNIEVSKVIEYIQLTKSGLGITVEQFVRIQREFSMPSRFFELLRMPYGISYKRAYNYIKKQEAEHGQNRMLTQWYDYIKDSEKLEYDLSVHSVLFPKDLPNAHAETIKILNAVRTEKEIKEMAALTNKLKHRYEFEYNDYIIKVPESMREIIAEGKALAHCVGGYAERHAKGQCLILFLRRRSEPDKPYFTIEVGGEWGRKQWIVQCHGYANERGTVKPKEVKEFEKEFERFLTDPIKYRAALKNVKATA